MSSIAIFLLVAISLQSMLSTWHADQSGLVTFSWAILASLLLLVSLLVHEFAHSIVAKFCDVKVRRITLFLFGGVAEMETEPKTPKDELLIAAAGPLTSLVLAALFFILATMSVTDFNLTRLPEGAIDMSAVPVATGVALWLSAINFILALFNLLPGFPMDGGRVFRAFLWWRTQDFTKATLQAAKVGRRIGWIIAMWGVFLILQGNLGNGIWTIMIGCFIHYLASISASQTLVQNTLSGFNVESLMRTRFESVPSDLTITDFIDRFVLRSRQTLWPTILSNGSQGFVSATDIDLTSNRDDTKLVQEFIQPITELNSLKPDCNAADALRLLAESRDPLPVVRAGIIVGLLDNADVVRWLARNAANQD
ncbi:MAG: Zn-dependent protease [Candidatus Azotimanducaceae bacterium]